MSKQKSKSGIETSAVLASTPINPWVRLASTSTMPDRAVDVKHIETLLAERWAAKTAKNYAVGDSIAKTLQELHIAYNDDQKTWYTKPIPVVAATSATRPEKLTKKQARNKRQAEKNRKKKAKLEAGEDQSSESESDESEAEEEVKPRKKSKGN